MIDLLSCPYLPPPPPEWQAPFACGGRAAERTRLSSLQAAAKGPAMEEIGIRRAGPGDLAAVHALVERAYRGAGARRGWTHEDDLLEGARLPAGALEPILANPAQRLLIAEVGAAPVGCVQVTDKGGGTAHLGLLSVDPAIQARGLGRRLIAAAEAEAVRCFAARRMEMSVIRERPELIAWYERRGYRRTGAEQPFPSEDTRFGRPLAEGLAFVMLEKSLGPLQPD
jgi:ribosomal protein S18 acetylase RimI-like enzyme